MTLALILLALLQAEWDSIRTNMIQSYWADYTDHFATVCAENGLTMVQQETE